jgi:hypothetical protein
MMVQLFLSSSELLLQILDETRTYALPEESFQLLFALRANQAHVSSAPGELEVVRSSALSVHFLS